ncbi:hypothetical protein WSM22_20490 [Cytophagales bacterium WSM2-2]|nr:hypothetical protein WSM22_20490 [Cytophagales bacterium WSM2-2]
MRFIKLIFIISFLLTLTAFPLCAQFLKVSGKKIVDDKNNEVLLRGMGLGGWMLQEGYMLETASFANTQREIRARIQNLIGPVATDQFYTAWLTNHCTRQDIDSLARWGFNSVRLPMHYNLFTLPIQSEPTPGANTWLDTGFALTDSLIKWCGANKIYVILDLHAAPGGQGKDAAISDYDNTKPSLWESADNRAKTIALWKKLAQRYVNEPWVGGYDLINEPNWNFTAGLNQNGCDETNNSALWQLYADITGAIRTVDNRHIIFVEGNCWANNYTGFYKWDDNQVISFHKYWSNNDITGIQNSLNLRDKFNLPLWLGESGENSNQWFKDAIKLSESNNIGWAWWPLKKISSIVGPFTAKEEPDYRTLLTYWQTGGTKPAVDFATNALMKQADNLKVKNAVYHKDVIDAMFRQQGTNNTIPFAKNIIPGKIYFTDFDLGGNGYAYMDNDVADYHVSSGVTTSWNQGNSYRNDGVDIEKTTVPNAQGNGYDVGWTQDGEWMQYTSQVDSLSGYEIAVSYAAGSGQSKLRITVNDQTVATNVLPSTGGQWGTFTFHDVIIPKGTQKIKAVIETGGMNLAAMTFSYGKKASDISLKPLDAQTYLSTEKIIVNFNKGLNSSTLTATGWTCKVNKTLVSIKNLVASGANGYQVSFDLSQPITDADTITVSYSGTGVKSSDGSLLSLFTDLPVKNNLPLHLPIPGTIQSENFIVNYGLASEACSDAGGGLDMGYTSSGDYMDYNVRVSKTDSYILEVRCASNSTGGVIEVQQLDDTGTVLNAADVTVPVTGGWQKWTSATAKINLTAGPSRLRVKVVQPEFNLNWYKFTQNIISATEPVAGFSLYPNPAKKKVILYIPNELLNRDRKLAIYNSLGQMVKLPGVEDDSRNNLFISLEGLATGIYVLVFQSGTDVWHFKILVE